MRKYEFSLVSQLICGYRSMTHLVSPCPSGPSTAGSSNMQSNGCNECNVVDTNIMCSTCMITENTRSASSALPGFKLK